VGKHSKRQKKCCQISGARAPADRIAGRTTEGKKKIRTKRILCAAGMKDSRNRKSTMQLKDKRRRERGSDRVVGCCRCPCYVRKAGKEGRLSCGEKEKKARPAFRDPTGSSAGALAEGPTAQDSTSRLNAEKCLRIGEKLPVQKSTPSSGVSILILSARQGNSETEED